MKAFTRLASFASVVAVALLNASTAKAQHAGDIYVEDVAGRLYTGLISEGTIVHDARVFAAEFGEVFENFTDEPGFDSDAGAFQPGTSIGFNVLDAVRVWDGSDFDAPSPVTFTIGFATESVETGSGFVPGFDLPVAPNGEWHKHLNYVINDPAPAGIYLLSMELWSTDPGLAPSASFHIVFNQNADEAEHDVAIEFVEDEFVPGLRFEETVLVAGGESTWVVAGATPGERVTFFYGLQFGSSGVPGCPGTRVWVRSPEVMGAAVANAKGVAELTRFVSEAASGRTIYFGAGEKATCSVANLVEHAFP